MIATVQLPNDDAQFDASNYDNEKGGIYVGSVFIYLYQINVNWN